MKSSKNANLLGLAIGMGLVLTILTTLLPRTASDGLTYKGWPFPYTKTIDTGGRCIGIADEISGGCEVRRFPKNNANLAVNFLFWVSVSAVAVLAYRHAEKRRGA
jgi:hypothetical protein